MISVPQIHQWNPIKIHFHEFRYDFTIFFMTLNSYMNSWNLNSCMISWLWIHLHEFIHDFIHMNSDIWFHDILHDHEFIWIHDHEYICDISWPMNSYMNSCIGRISWNHTWNHVYQGSRWGLEVNRHSHRMFCSLHHAIRNVYYFCWWFEPYIDWLITWTFASKGLGIVLPWIVENTGKILFSNRSSLDCTGQLMSPCEAGPPATPSERHY